MKKLLQTIFVLCLAGTTLKAQCPVASAGSDQTVCTGTTVTLAATLPAMYTGTWTKVFAFPIVAGTITTAGNASSTVTGLTGAGIIRLVWTITDGASCTAIRDTVVINIQASATTANAGADQTICAGGTATLAATAPTGGNTGTWVKVLTGGHTSSPSAITSVSSPTTTVTGLNTAGINDTLRWTVTNATCGGTAGDDMIIKVNAAPTPAYAGSDQQTCQGATVQLIGNTPTIGTPSWALPAGGGATFVPATATSSSTATITTTTGGGQIPVVYKISTGTGATVLNGCVSIDTVVVTFNPSVANAGPDQSICQTPATVTLAATPVAAGETGSWSIINIKPLGSSAVITNTLSPTTTVTAITSDTLTLRWTVNGGGCSDTDDMNVIKLTAPSVAFAGPIHSGASGANDITGCVGDTVQLTGSPALSGTPLWTIGGGGFFPGVTLIPNGNNDTIRARLRTAGTYKLYYTISVGTSTVTGTCSTSRDSLNIFVNALPVATIVAPAGGGSPNQTSCTTGPTTFTITARKPVTGSTGVWSIVTQPGTAGTVVQNDTVGIVSGLAQGVTTLAWTVNNGICSRKATMTITAGAPTTANAGNDINNGCVGDTITLYGSIATSGTPTWSNAHPPAAVGGFGGFGGTRPKSIRFIPTNGRNDTVKVILDTAGTFTLYYTIAIGTVNIASACTSRDSMNITVTTNCGGVGIDENNNGGLTVSIQPNPASEWFSLSIKDTQTSFAEVSVLATDGRIIETEQLGIVKDIVKTINISNLSNGMYFVKVKKGDEIFVTKLVVQ